MYFICLDYFYSSIGILYNKESPTSLSFCVALLREILCNLKPSHVLWDKVKYAAFLLNLAARDVEFSVLYEIFYQVKGLFHALPIFYVRVVMRIYSLYDKPLKEQVNIRLTCIFIT